MSGIGFGSIPQNAMSILGTIASLAEASPGPLPSRSSLRSEDHAEAAAGMTSF
jgi:hypothetical protein